MNEFKNSRANFFNECSDKIEILMSKNNCDRNASYPLYNEFVKLFSLFKDTSFIKSIVRAAFK
jgi:hypothetical protein